MNPKNRAERIAALDTITDEAKNLADSGADSLDVQAFISGARKELVKQRPDVDSYRQAVDASRKAQGMLGKYG
jgi:hypothetical protein